MYQVVEGVKSVLLGVYAVEQVASIALEAADAGAGARQAFQLPDEDLAAPGVP